MRIKACNQNQLKGQYTSFVDLAFNPMSHALDVLGGITAEQFLTEYWQKKTVIGT